MSLRNQVGNAKDNIDYNMNLYFTYESRDTLMSFTLFVAVKAIAKLNWENNDKFEINIF